MNATLSAEEAAAELGISVATLYAYVSRGYLRSVAEPGSRRRRYVAADIVAFRQRRSQHRDPGKAAEGALHWGLPVLESRISFANEGSLYYRGKDVVALARSATFARVLGLLWNDDESIVPTMTELAGGRAVWSAVQRAVRGLPPLEAFQVALPMVAAHASNAYDLRPAAVVRAGARILSLLAAVATGSEPADDLDVARLLQTAWLPRDRKARALLDAALIVYADNGLSPSTFAARCVASAGSSPYAVVGAGVAALQGAKHGGASERAEALLREAANPGGARRAVADRLRRGEAIPGFGHPLYPAGDPRARLLLQLVAARAPRSGELALAHNLAAAVDELMGQQPNVDFAVVTLCRVLALPAGAPLTLLALGRTAGWIAHALEQYDEGRTIRPHARYAGAPPETTDRT
jgi:citrate synthase